MAGEQTQSIALLSINPEFAYLILEGSKRVEFRKTRFAADVSCVVIYATAPVKKVVGFFAVDDVIEGTPCELWSRFQEIAGIDSRRFFSYFNTTRSAVGILVREAFTLEMPVDLDALEIQGPPPQNFRYLSGEAFNKVSELKLAKKASILNSAN